MSKEAKVIRGQVRQAVQEILPSILTQEQFKVLEKLILDRLAVLSNEVKKTMAEINENHQKTMGYLVRSVTTPTKKD